MMGWMGKTKLAVSATESDTYKFYLLKAVKLLYPLKVLYLLALLNKEQNLLIFLLLKGEYALFLKRIYIHLT